MGINIEYEVFGAGAHFAVTASVKHAGMYRLAFVGDAQFNQVTIDNLTFQQVVGLKNSLLAIPAVAQAGNQN